MSQIGHIPYFSRYYCDFDIFMDRLELYFQLNNTPEEMKIKILIIALDEDIYTYLRHACYPELPMEKTFGEITDLLRQCASPKKSVYRARYEFYNAKKEPEVNIHSWLDNIRALSMKCKFGTDLEEILRDRFISGLPPSPILDRLCEENLEDLTLQKAIDIAIDKESALDAIKALKDAKKNDDDTENSSKSKRRRNRRKRGKNQQNDEQVEESKDVDLDTVDSIVFRQ